MRLRRTRPLVSIPALHGHCDVVGRVAPASIGEILVGAAESGSPITMGPASRVDLRIGIALGSCVQIALFVLRCWCWSRLPFRQYHVAALWDSWSISWVAK